MLPLKEIFEASLIKRKDRPVVELQIFLGWNVMQWIAKTFVIYGWNILILSYWQPYTVCNDCPKDSITGSWGFLLLILCCALVDCLISNDIIFSFFLYFSQVSPMFGVLLPLGFYFSFLECWSSFFKFLYFFSLVYLFLKCIFFFGGGNIVKDPIC